MLDKWLRQTHEKLPQVLGSRFLQSHNQGENQFKNATQGKLHVDWDRCAEFKSVS